MEWLFRNNDKLLEPFWCGFCGYEDMIPGEDRYHNHGSYKQIIDDCLEVYETCPEKKVFKLVNTYEKLR